MRHIFILGCLIFSIAAMNFAYTLDWRALHDNADEISIAQALSKAQEYPDSIDNLYVLGLVYLGEHRDKEALEVFNKINSLNSKIIEARWGIAEVLRRQHKIGESEEILNEIVKINPDFSPAYITLAYIKYTQMNFEQSVKLALKVIKQGRENVDLSNYTRAHLLLAGAKGMIASRGGPLSKVINGTAVLPNLKKAEMLQPDSPAVMFGLGSFYFLAPRIAGGDINKAIDYLEKAIGIDPKFADAYVRLAQIYNLKGDNEKYQRYLNKAKEIDPENTLLQDFEKKQCRFNCIAVEE